MHRVRCVLLVAILGIASNAGYAFAQGNTSDLRIRLDAGQNAPMSGALVAIVNGDRVVSEGLSSQRGTITLSAAPGTYRIRVRRIGYYPFLSDPITLPFNNELVLHIDTDRVVLDAMVVSASAQCGAIKKDAQTLSAVWDEISKALRASQLTVNDLGGMGRMLTYKRELGTHGEVISSDTSTLPITTERPFGVPDPPSLAAIGYVRGNPQTGWEYFGPDEAVLLSDDFAATHCFKVVRDKKRAGQIGVAFEPAPGRKLSDIKGVLWVDEKTAELRDVGFVYVNAGILSDFEPGGFTKFRRVPSGAWIVSEWQLKMPKLEMRIGYREGVSQIGSIENGGVIVSENGVKQAGATATVTGIAWDSVTQSAVSGATVAIDQAFARTDDNGRFKFTGVPLGTRMLSLSGPMVSALGLVSFEKEILIERDTASVMLSLPSFAATWRRICSDTLPVANSGILHGFVTSPLGDPVANAPVNITWREAAPLPDSSSKARGRLSVQVSTDKNGHYVACGLRRTAAGSVVSQTSDGVSEERNFNFAGSYFLRRDLLISPVAATADTRREIVVAVTDSAGEPVADVLAYIAGTTETGRTDDEGRASLRTANTQLSVGVRKVGYAEQIFSIRLGENQQQLLRVVMRPAQMLATVNVVAKAPMPAEIERRRDQGRGTFYGPEEISQAHELRSLISRAAGAKIEGVGRWVLKFRAHDGGECIADLYIDGRLSAPRLTGEQVFEELNAYPTDDIYAIEVFSRVSEVPPQYSGLRDGCGALMVWTRGYAEAEIEKQQRRTPSSAADSTKKK